MKLALLFALASAALAGPALAQANAEFAATTLSLSAIGDVRTPPDRATLNLGVAAEQPTAAEAMRQNGVQMAKVIAALKAAGVPDRAIRTQGVNLQPQYVYAPNQPQRLTGYRANNLVTVSLEAMDRVGPVLDAAVAAGANEVNGISFSIDNPAAAEDQARAEAVRALRRKAELYAQANGLKLGRLVRMSEGFAGGPQPLAQDMAFAVRAAAPAPPRTPVQAGELDVRVEVNAVYELTALK